MSSWRSVSDRLTGKAPRGASRSSGWRSFRNGWLSDHPRCEFCKGRRECVAHHLIPFWMAPEFELDPTNVVTLCERGKYGVGNCHLFFGHRGNWRNVNIFCLADVERWRRVVKLR
jgi:hypothetical protein